MTNELLRQAIRAAQAGRREEARTLFLQLVAQDERQELAWLWLVDLVDDVEDQIIALENVLTLNPQHQPARQRLAALQTTTRPGANPAPPTPDTMAAWLAVAANLAADRQYAAAQQAYRAALKLAPGRAQRQHIRRRLKEAQRHARLTTPVATHSTFNWLRLSLGPILMYGLLLLIQAGYRPGQLSPLLCAGTLPVVAGSLLLVGSRLTHRHPLWQRILGPAGFTSFYQRLSLGALGFLLLTAPYLLLFLLALQRLRALQQTWSP